MKNKILEAMAMGKAIVTTSEGTSGIGGSDGVHYRVADDAPGFARQVLDLLAQPQQRQALGQAARTFVATHYSWERTGDLFDQLYQRVAGRAESGDRQPSLVN